MGQFGNIAGVNFDGQAQGVPGGVDHASAASAVFVIGHRLQHGGAGLDRTAENLVDVFHVADRIAVLYLGRMVVQDAASNFDRQSVVEYMTTGGAGVKADARANGGGPGRGAD